MSRRRSLLLAVPLLLVAACQTVIDPIRVPEGGGATITVSSSGLIFEIPGEPPIPVEGPNSCLANSAVEVFMDDGVEPVGTGTADGSGDFAVEIDAPTEPGSYEIYAVCSTTEPPNVSELFPVTLVVEPDLELTAVPSALGPGEELEVTGTWCVSQDDDAGVPTASVTFDGETQDLTAESAQPFGESWSATFTAPEAAGTYQVTATCTYDEVDPDSMFGEIPIDELPLELRGAAAAADGAAPAAVDVAYDPATVVVDAEAPVEPAPEPEPTPTPRAPEAAPTGGVQPTYTG